MSHALKARPLVRLKQPAFSDAQTNPAGIYEISHLMPADPTGALSYWMQSGAIERIVPENELQSLSSPEPFI